LGAIFDQKLKKGIQKGIQKSIPKKYRKMMPKGSQNDAKMDAKINDFSIFWGMGGFSKITVLAQDLLAFWRLEGSKKHKK